MHPKMQGSPQPGADGPPSPFFWAWIIGVVLLDVHFVWMRCCCLGLVRRCLHLLVRFPSCLPRCCCVARIRSIRVMVEAARPRGLGCCAAWLLGLQETAPACSPGFLSRTAPACSPWFLTETAPACSPGFLSGTAPACSPCILKETAPACSPFVLEMLRDSTRSARPVLDAPRCCVLSR